MRERCARPTPLTAGPGSFPVRCLLLLGCLLCASPLQAARSVIVEASGSACAAKGAVTAKTEQQALYAALDQAHLLAGDHVVTQLSPQDNQVERDLRKLYQAAPVRGLQQLNSERYKSGPRRCVRVRIRAEVAPEEKLLQQLAGGGPASPLQVQVWPERSLYRQGEKITFFLRGNKPFYGSIVYTDAGDNIVQILPNRYRPEAFFEAGRTHQLPGEGEFSIVVYPPQFGTERITVYAATVSLDRIAEIVPTGDGVSEPGLGPNPGRKPALGEKPPEAVEYVEVSTSLTTTGEL